MYQINVIKPSNGVLKDYCQFAGDHGLQGS